AGLLHVLAGTGHGVAGGQGECRERSQQQQGKQTLHGGSPGDRAIGTDRSATGWSAHAPMKAHPAVKPACSRRDVAKPRMNRVCDASFQSRIRVDLPNRLSTRSTVSLAVALRRSSAGLTSTMSSEAM